jgi:hypothetical protein
MEQAMEKMRKQQEEYEEMLAKTKAIVQTNVEEKKKVIKNPYLSNINQDSTMSGMINRELNPGSNLVGKETPEFRPTIPVKGAGLASKHCTIEYNQAEDKTTVFPNEEFNNYTVKINGELVQQPTVMNPGDRILFGSHIYYIYIHPKVNKDATFEYEDAVKEANKESMRLGEVDEKAAKDLEEMKTKLLEESDRQKKQIEA